jgi:hypothetical protein
MDIHHILGSLVVAVVLDLEVAMLILAQEVKVVTEYLCPVSHHLNFVRHLILGTLNYLVEEDL